MASPKHAVHRLVWYEIHESILSAIQREKSLKKYKRDWKINLTERENPYWDDLYPALVGTQPGKKTEIPATDKAALLGQP